MASLFISLHFPASTGPIGATFFRGLAHLVLSGEGIHAASVTGIFVDDGEIARLNETWVGHEGPTDVITFPLGEGEDFEGEVYISVDTARRQAAEYGVPLRLELARLWVHGILHLCGHEDGRPEQRQAMSRLEDRYLTEAGLFGGRNALT